MKSWQIVNEMLTNLVHEGDAVAAEEVEVVVVNMTDILLLDECTFLMFMADDVEILKRPLIKLGVRKPLPGNLQLQLPKLIVMRKRRMQMSLPLLQRMLQTLLRKRLRKLLKRRKKRLKHTPTTSRAK
jgi:hypothetical protein